MQILNCPVQAQAEGERQRERERWREREGGKGKGREREGEGREREREREERGGQGWEEVGRGGDRGGRGSGGRGGGGGEREKGVISVHSLRLAVAAETTTRTLLHLWGCSRWFHFQAFLQLLLQPEQPRGIPYTLLSITPHCCRFAVPVGSWQLLVLKHLLQRNKHSLPGGLWVKAFGSAGTP